MFECHIGGRSQLCSQIVDLTLVTVNPQSSENVPTEFRYSFCIDSIREQNPTAVFVLTIVILNSFGNSEIA